MLHILMHSPYKININLMCNMFLFQHSLIALQDGVLIALNKNIFLPKILSCSMNLYLLKEDVVARGIERYVCSNFSVINYIDFVRLTEKYNKFMNW